MPNPIQARRRIKPDRPHHVIARGQLSDGSTFTNADERTYFDSDGLLQTASANEARTTYIDGVPYLLMEGERTNLLQRSEEFDFFDTVSNSWEKVVGATVTANQGTAPDGESTGDLLSVPSGGFIRQLVEMSTTVSAAATVYVKKAPSGSATHIRITTNDVGAWNTGGSTKHELTDDWERISVSWTTDATDGSSYVILGARDVGGVSDADCVGDVLIWGAQAEEASHESSYIKTTTASVTRAADAASLTNSIISGLTEGTIYAEVYTDHLTSDAARHIAELESDASNFIRVLHAADGDLDAQITDGGASQAALAGTDLTVGELEKVALTFKANEFSLYRGGSQLATDTSGTMPSVDTLLIGAGLYGGIKTMNVHTTAWSQAKAEAETT